MTFTLHDYQIVARDFLRGRGRCALFLDMGLGKTASSLSALEPRHLPALVVAPKRVAETVWPVERKIWRPDLSLSLAAGEPGVRRAALLMDDDIVVIGRDNAKDLVGLKRKRPFKTVIIDELSGYKSHTSARYKMMRKLVNEPGLDYVWGLTGTPSPNGLLDVWPQVALLDNGARLGKNITTYRSRYFMPGRQIANGTIVEWNLREGAEEKIQGLIEDICLSMSSEGRIHLPDVTHNTVGVELPPEVRKAYRQISNDLVVNLKEIFGGEIHTAGSAAILTSKLSQISAGFLYEDAEYEPSPTDADEYTLVNEGEYTPMHREKVKAVQEIVDGSGGSQVLVFFRFRAEYDMLKEAFGDKAFSINEPGVIEAWNENRGRVPVMLAHPASAGHGLNLQHGGHTIVWTTPTWSLEEWEQGNKRLHRQGQKHPVVIHVITGNRTVDHLILARIVDKAVVQDSLLAHLESPI